MQSHKNINPEDLRYSIIERDPVKRETKNYEDRKHNTLTQHTCSQWFLSLMWLFKQAQTFALLGYGVIAPFVLKVPNLTLQIDDS